MINENPSSTSFPITRYLRPDKFDVEPDAAEADAQWQHWRSTFESFLNEEVKTDLIPDALRRKLLVNHLSASIYKHIKTCETYEASIAALEGIYIKPKNIILARHILFNRKQRADENISDYVRALRLAAKDCSFETVTAQEHEEQAIRSTLISGLLSRKIKERLLENKKLTLAEALDQAIALETAEKDALIISNNSPQINAIYEQKQDTASNIAAATQHRPSQTILEPSSRSVRCCFFCGGNVHQRFKCPAFRAICNLCSKRGHFSNVCKSRNATNNSASFKNTVNSLIDDGSSHCSTISAASPSSLKGATILITVNGYKADALVDTGSSVSFINRKIARLMKLRQKPCTQSVNLASLNQVSVVEGICFANITMNKHNYRQIPLLIVDNLCADVIVGHDLLKEHSKIEFELGGPHEPLRICNVMQSSVPPASIFTNLSPNIRPIAVRSRRYSIQDEEFIKQEISKLLEDGVIEPSISPWRAQVLVAGELDAFPLPNMEAVVSKVSKYKIFSQIDLKSAYHQMPILDKEKVYTAFEACGQLYQFTRIPFGVTNGVAAFQRTLDFIITREKLEGTFVYLDDVTVCGKDE
ncbi:uncharacterized protein LOC116163922 [Photinus pyralis]|uniref:uncharacterized protein LOC116163922 n=1 Tax=Photinus pyralis TaxID=7054 RepID=UPI001267730E|nr:uncharacterized protein LOC116163922 [Photinus pyralis]